MSNKESNTKQQTAVSAAVETTPARKRQLDWNANNGRLKLILANAVSKFKAHVKTPDMKLEAKWSLVTGEFAVSTKENDQTPKSLQAAFNRATQGVLRSYGLDAEQIDLSRLPKDVPELDRLLIELAAEAGRTQSNRKSSGGKQDAETSEAVVLPSAPKSAPPPPVAAQPTASASSSSTAVARGSTARGNSAPKAVAAKAAVAEDIPRKNNAEVAPVVSANDEVLQLEIRKRKAEVERYQLETEQIAKRYKSEEEQRVLQNKLEAQRLQQNEKMTTAFVALTELLRVVSQKLDS